MRPRHRKQAGAALLLVIWVVALLSLLAATALQITTTTAHIAEAAQVRAGLEAAADGAVNLALLSMIDPDSSSAQSANYSARNFQVNGQTVVVSIHDEAGKVDVNQASDALLTAVFVEAGATTENAQAWVKALNSRRGTSRGGSATQSASGGVSMPLRTVDESAEVSGMHRADFRCIKPLLTVYTGLGNVDRRFADAAVRRAMARVLAGDAQSAAVTPTPAVGDDSSSAGRVFSIRAVATAGVATFSRQVIVRITGDPAQPYLIALRNEEIAEDSLELTGFCGQGRT